jgi:AbrB family looped-hinge helix DNA binding protein
LKSRFSTLARWHTEWYRNGMRTTIDAAGRLVIPKRLREEVGLGAGEVEVTAYGGSLRIEPVAADSLEERDGRFVIPAVGVAVDDELVRALRDADQR